MDTLCLIRDIYRSIGDFEANFQQTRPLSKTKGCCCIRCMQPSSGEIAAALGPTHSNASKVIKSVEDKGW